MVTLHPFDAYYKSGETISHLSFLSISENNTHNTTAVHLFLKDFHKYLRSKVPVLIKIIYFSDGCAAQYKNCTNFLNLCHHPEDVGVSAVWNFLLPAMEKDPAMAWEVQSGDWSLEHHSRGHMRSRLRHQDFSFNSVRKT